MKKTLIKSLILTFVLLCFAGCAEAVKEDIVDPKTYSDTLGVTFTSNKTLKGAAMNEEHTYYFRNHLEVKIGYKYYNENGMTKNDVFKSLEAKCSPLNVNGKTIYVTEGAKEAPNTYQIFRLGNLGCYEVTIKSTSKDKNELEYYNSFKEFVRNSLNFAE